MSFINTKILPNLNVGDSFPPIIQGIINLSPESFYKNSVVSKDNLIKSINNFLENNAKILDIGARSTAPGVIPITREVELDRIKPILDEVIKIIPKDIAVSIDTQYSEIAEYCFKLLNDCGIGCIINDVSGLKTDPDMVKIITEYSIPLILMASNKKPGDILSVNSILKSLHESIIDLERMGYPVEKLILDPGIGKWVPEKTYEYDLGIIDNLERFRVFGQPILVGISRKSFLGTVLGGKPATERMYGSFAANVIAVYNGAHIIRTHDVSPQFNDMIKIAKAIRKKPLLETREGVSGSYLGCVKEPVDAIYFMRRMGVTPAGSRIMGPKAVTKLILLNSVTAPQALILKQEMLARGGDAAIHKDVVTTEFAKYDAVHNVLLIGTEKQLLSLVSKLQGQQLELDKMSILIKNLIERSKEDKFLHRI